MAFNATRLQEELLKRNLCDKMVIFFGAMDMNNEAEKGDALGNMQSALENIDTLGAGVYVVGRDIKTHKVQYFDPVYVEKEPTVSVQDLALTFMPLKEPLGACL